MKYGMEKAHLRTSRCNGVLLMPTSTVDPENSVEKRCDKEEEDKF